MSPRFFSHPLWEGVDADEGVDLFANFAEELRQPLGEKMLWQYDFIQREDHYAFLPQSEFFPNRQMSGLANYTANNDQVETVPMNTVKSKSVKRKKEEELGSEHADVTSNKRKSLKNQLTRKC